MNSNYVENEFREDCNILSENIKSACGLSYELYQRRMSKGIEEIINNLPDENKKAAYKIARDEFYYVSKQQIKSLDEELGLCSHGIDPQYCPCGCGDLD